MTDSDRIIAISKYFDSIHATKPWFWQWHGLLSDYDYLKSEGMSRSSIVNAMKKSYDISIVGPFVAAADMLNRNIPIQSTTEAPGWAEAYDMGLGPVSDLIPWGKLIVGGVVALGVWGFATRAGTGVAKRAFAPKIPRP